MVPDTGRVHGQQRTFSMWCSLLNPEAVQGNAWQHGCEGARELTFTKGLLRTPLYIDNANALVCKGKMLMAQLPPKGLTSEVPLTHNSRDYFQCERNIQIIAIDLRWA